MTNQLFALTKEDQRKGGEKSGSGKKSGGKNK